MKEKVMLFFAVLHVQTLRSLREKKADPSCLMKVQSQLILFCLISTLAGWPTFQFCFAALPLKKGGTLNLHINNYPSSLNKYTGSDAYTDMFSGLVLEGMVYQEWETYSNVPRLAEKWTVGADELTYTFFLQPKATWSDGRPVTASDVEFTFKTIIDEKKCLLCASVRSYVGPIAEVVVIDSKTIRLVMKTKHFQNLERLGGVLILPQHVYGKPGRNFNKDFDKMMVGSGPYIMDPVKGRREITLRRNKRWWGATALPHLAQEFNFDKLRVRIIKETQVAFELFKKRELDFFYFDSTLFGDWDRLRGKPWTDNRAGRITAPFIFPVRWGGLVLNMRRPPLDELDFRRALQLLFNRPLFLDKIYGGKHRAVTGPFAYQSVFSANIKPTLYDPIKAETLLAQVGYKQVGEDGILYKSIPGPDGKIMKQRASVTLMYASEGNLKWATIFKEAAYKKGIEINLQFTEWTSASRLLDEFQFDLFPLAWAEDPVPSPANQFHGRSANEIGSSNRSGLNDSRINQLIDQAPMVFDFEKRQKLFQELERLIVDTQPYVFTSVQKEHLVGYWTDKIDPGDKPFLPYSGTVERNPFWIRWAAR